MSVKKWVSIFAAIVLVLLCGHIMLVEYSDAYANIVNKEGIRAHAFITYWFSPIYEQPYDEDKGLQFAGWSDGIYIMVDKDERVTFAVPFGTSWKRLNIKDFSWKFTGKTFRVTQERATYDIRKVNGIWYAWVEYPITYADSVKTATEDISQINTVWIETKNYLEVLYRINDATYETTISEIIGRIAHNIACGEAK